MNTEKRGNHTKINFYSREVSIIGIGCTPFTDNPEPSDITEKELLSYAALKAIEDAGISPKEIDFYFHGQTHPSIDSDSQITEWFGMKGKGMLCHSEGSSTGYLALEQAANAVASGKYEVVLSACVDLADRSWPWKQPSDPRTELCLDEAAITYQRRYGLTEEEIDDTLICMALANRKNASKNPLAVKQIPYEEIAKQMEIDDVHTFMKSHARIGQILRPSGLGLTCDGAAAIVVASTKWAAEHELPHTPIEILGIGCAGADTNTPHYETLAMEEAIRQVYELTQVTPDEIDLLTVNDPIISTQLIAAEVSGYLPKGESWKYFVEGRTAYDGDKPINTHGGRTSFGHAQAASGLADIYEAVLQMRESAGERQVKELPITTLLCSGGENSIAILLETNESMRKDDQTAHCTDSPIKLEAMTQEYHENLEAGKIVGRKCKICGHIEWPPHPACNECGSMDLEWVEMSGKGMIERFILDPQAEYMDLMPYALASVTMDGVSQNTIVQGISLENAEDCWAMIPVPVKAKIIEKGKPGNQVKTVLFELDQEEIENRK